MQIKQGISHKLIFDSEASSVSFFAHASYTSLSAALPKIRNRMLTPVDVVLLDVHSV